jgi:hypothetical protein
VICELFPKFCNFSKYCNYSLYINLQNYLSISITCVNIYLQIPRSARGIGPCCLISAGPDFRPPAPIRTVCGIAPAGVAHNRPGKTAASTGGRHPAAACVAQGRRACCLLRWCGCGCMVGLAARGRRWRWRCTLARAPRSRTGASSGTGALPYTTTARRYSGVIALALHVVRPGVGASGFWLRPRPCRGRADCGQQRSSRRPICYQKSSFLRPLLLGCGYFILQIQARQGRPGDARLQHGPGSCRPPLHAAVKCRAGQQRQREGGQQTEGVGQQLRRPEMADQRIDQQAHRKVNQKN